jgi:hypothetical protein
MDDAVDRALAFVESHGVVMASASGPAPRLIEAIAGEPIPGNWWSHPQGNFIYNVLAQVRDSERVLVCRLVNDKLTLVHDRLWAALVCIADRFPEDRLAHVHEEHTASGRHAVREVPFPEWVPAEVAKQAKLTCKSDAAAIFRRWLPSLPPSARKKSSRR